MYQQFDSDTICAISTPSGVGGIAIIRVSGPEAFNIVDTIWRGRKLSEVTSHTAHLGDIIDPENEEEPLDTAVATVFRAPRSFTGENVVEISVHGSKWIQRELLNLLIRRGCRMAGAGEFTRRAFANGRLDLAQAEAVADVIAASSRSAHRLAASQMRGDFSKHISELRDQLVEIASLLELELDFSEEDVEFASRQHLKNLAEQLLTRISSLVSSFSTGSALKEGVPVAIIGEPNAGKSTLLNLLLNDNRAIVSDIPGTTRDTIEDTMEIDGVLYRFIDTAGIRETTDAVENLGIERSYTAISKARIVIWLVTPDMPQDRFQAFRKSIAAHLPEGSNLIVAVNKIDTLHSSACNRPINLVNGDSVGIDSTDDAMKDEKHVNENFTTKTFGVSSMNPSFALFTESTSTTDTPLLYISASTGLNISSLLKLLHRYSGADESGNADLIVTNARHYEALTHARSSLIRVINGIDTGLSGDFIAQDLRETIHHLSSITGTITTDDLLKTIFERFCIGK